MSTYRAFSYSSPVPTDADGAHDEIMIGRYDTDGGCDYEFAIRWYNLGTVLLYARIELYEDTWKALMDCADIWPALAEMCGKRPTPGDIMAVLLQYNFNNESRPTPLPPPVCPTCNRPIEKE